MNALEDLYEFSPERFSHDVSQALLVAAHPPKNINQTEFYKPV